ncbi:AAA family ATPase [Deferribacter abyssi]|uniref:AAA family ATPase n=1 Tax=Deferribacter abyssi TaxID=213806 RepID=UPI003C1F20A3
MSRKTKVITITSGKGGVGKTNISLNLSIALTKLNYKVALLDADLALGNVDLLIGSKPKYTIEDIVKRDIPIDEIIIEHDKLPNFSLIPAGSGILELTRLTNKERNKLKNEISKIKLLYDFLVIDTGAGISSEIISFIKLADEVIVILLPEVTSIKDSYSVLKVLKEKGVFKNYRILINRAKSKQQVATIFEKFKDTVRKFLQIDVQLLGFLPDEENFQESVNRQIPLLNLYPNSVAAKLLKYYANLIAVDNNLKGIEIDELFDSIVKEETKSLERQIEENEEVQEVVDLNLCVAQIEKKLAKIIEETNELLKFSKLLKRQIRAELVSESFFNEFKIGSELVFVENKVKFYSSKIIGWDFGKYLICETSRDIDKLFEMYDVVTARYSFEDSLVEFKTKIFGEIESSNLILISYPKDYLITKLRDYKRIIVKIPCNINYKGIKLLSAIILDLSVKGALIHVNYPCDIGDCLRLNFILPNGKEIKNVQAVIRNVRDKNRYGILFTEISALYVRRIERFIDIYYRLFASKTNEKRLEKISGELKDFSFFDIIQISSASTKNIMIEFFSESGEGKIYFKNGRIVHAVIDNKEGVDAFYEISMMKDGEFYINEFEEDIKETIDVKTDVLLLNSAYFTDVKGRKNGD